MRFGYVRSRWQAESQFSLSRLEIILREPLPDLSSGATNYRILIGIVMRLPIENIDPKSPLFHAIEVAIHSGLNDMPKETATLLTGSKLMALENPVEFG